MEYPERSVHETLVNAFIHRDYLVTGSEVHVDIFDDRIEITSPGGMPGERKIEDFDINCIPSIRRNPLLADMCERLRIMERRGSGFKKIFEDYTENFVNPGRREPVIESNPAYFRVTLPNMIYGFTDEQLVASAKNPKALVVTPVATPDEAQVMPPVVPPVGKPSETLINEIQHKILCVLRGGLLSASEISAGVGISRTNNVRRRYLRLLLDMGLVEYTIPNKPNSKNQQYRLTARGSEIVESRNHGQGAKRVMEGAVTHLQGNSQSADDALKNALRTTLKNLGKSDDDSIVARILELYRQIVENPRVTLGAVAQEMSLSERTIDEYVTILKNSGALRRKDGKKFGVWETLM